MSEDIYCIETLVLCRRDNFELVGYPDCPKIDAKKILKKIISSLFKTRQKQESRSVSNLQFRCEVHLKSN